MHGNGKVLLVKSLLVQDILSLHNRSEDVGFAVLIALFVIACKHSQPAAQQTSEERLA